MNIFLANLARMVASILVYKQSVNISTDEIFVHLLNKQRLTDFGWTQVATAACNGMFCHKRGGR